jgi:hypothetical protein
MSFAVFSADDRLITAERLMLLGGIFAFLLTVYWVRRRVLREKYAVSWMVVSFLLLVCGIFPDLIKYFAVSSQLSYPSAVLFIALAVVYLFSLGISISMTKQYRRSVRLMQELAIQEYRLRQLEVGRPLSNADSSRATQGARQA